MKLTVVNATEEKFSGVGMKRRAMTISRIPKPRDNAHKRKNSGTPQLQLKDDTKKVLNTLMGGIGDATDEYEPDFKGAEKRDLNIMGTLGNSYFL